MRHAEEYADRAVGMRSSAEGPEATGLGVWASWSGGGSYAPLGSPRKQG